MNQTLTRVKVKELQKEVELLRSFVIGIAGKDEEGEYNPTFVRKTLMAIRNMPRYKFRDKNSFLRQLG